MRLCLGASVFNLQAQPWDRLGFAEDKETRSVCVL